MGVMTRAEYQEKKAAKPKGTVKKKPTGEGGLRKIDLGPPKPVEKSLFVLLHPERPEYGTLNFREVITLKDKPYLMLVENGVLKTTEKVLVDYLMSRQYQLIQEIKENVHKKEEKAQTDSFR